MFRVVGQPANTNNNQLLLNCRHTRGLNEGCAFWGHVDMLSTMGNKLHNSQLSDGTKNASAQTFSSFYLDWHRTNLSRRLTAQNALVAQLSRQKNFAERIYLRGLSCKNLTLNGLSQSNQFAYLKVLGIFNDSRRTRHAKGLPLKQHVSGA